MSGICGVIHFDGAPVEPALLERIAQAAAYRGPDGMHYHFAAGVGLGHLALHVTPEDPLCRQPLLSADGRLAIVADARIDNRDDLIPLLQSKGWLEKQPARSFADVEVILAAYQMWGLDCPAHLLGDFAFAVWDAGERRLLAARDAYGSRPLCYRRLPNGLQFASQAAMLLADPDCPRQPDEVYIARFMAAGASDPRLTPWQEIEKIDGRERLLAGPADWRIERYSDFDPNFSIRYANSQEYVEHFEHLFRRAVRDRLRSTHPVSLFMSGGFDSASIAVIAADELRRNPAGLAPEVRLVHWKAPEEYPQFDESPLARAVAEKCGLPYREIDAKTYTPLYGYPEQPLSDADDVYRSWYCGLYRQSFASEPPGQPARTWLNGLAGDLAVGGIGYDYYYQMLRQGQFRRFQHELQRQTALYAWGLSFSLKLLFWEPWIEQPLGFVRRYVLNQLRKLKPGAARTAGRQWMLQQTPLGLIDPQHRHPEWRGLGRNRRYRRLRYFVNVPLNEDLERMCAVAQAQTACAYQDLRLLDFLLAIPDEEICRGLENKWILRQAVWPLMPEQMNHWRARRGGLPSYINVSLRQAEPAAMMTGLLASSLSARAGWVNQPHLKTRFEAYQQAECKFSNQMWFYLCLEDWLRRYHPAI